MAIPQKAMKVVTITLFGNPDTLFRVNLKKDNTYFFEIKVPDATQVTIIVDSKWNYLE